MVARVRAGSAAAFEVLFDRHHRPLLAFCRHMLGSAVDAEDAVQHTFMAAYADLMRSDKPIALRPWLYSIARHRCVSMLRARRERPVAELPEPEVDHLAAEVDAREELRAALADVAHLPEDQRAALILAELGDASHAEIAQILGCRQEKVKALVYQARSSLASDRVARNTPCAEIREQLALGGMAMRRTSLRRHVRHCTGCREFDELVRVQRRRLRILLPVAPSVGFKRAVLGVLAGSGSGAASGVTAIVGGLAATAVVSVTVATSGGSPASAAPGGRDAPTAAITGPAWVNDHRPPTGTTPHVLRPESEAGQWQPQPGAPIPGAEPAGAPVTRAAPVDQDAHAPAHASEETDGTPADGRASPEPPDHERRADPPESPGGGNPDGPPGGGKPEVPPAGGRPDGPAGGGKPDGPPSGGKPDGSAGHGKPDRPPGGGRPDGPAGGGKPDAPQGGGRPDGPAGGRKPDAPQGGAQPDEPAGSGKPDAPRAGGQPDGPPADPRPEAAGDGPSSGTNDSDRGRPPR